MDFSRRKYNFFAVYKKTIMFAAERNPYPYIGCIYLNIKARLRKQSGFYYGYLEIVP
jgi:hypothetical protein